MSEEKVSHSEQQARAQLDSIKLMVAGLQLDFDRLEELRDERDDFEGELEDVPDDFPVTVLDDDDEATERMTCGECGRSWDDAVVTSYTPAPSARCPFEAYHGKTSWAEENADDAEELADMEKLLAEFQTNCGRELTCEDDVRDAINEDPLDIQVRSDWVSLGDWPGEPSQFLILLCTGGPAVRIVGELSSGDPQRAWLEHQDWGTPWTELPNSEGDMDALLTYARCFCFEVDR